MERRGKVISYRWTENRKGTGTNSGESGARNLEAESIRSRAECTGGCVKLKSQRSDGVVLVSNSQEMTGNDGVAVTSCRLSVLLLLGTATIIILIILILLHCISVIPCHWLVGLHLSKGGHRRFQGPTN